MMETGLGDGGGCFLGWPWVGGVERPWGERGQDIAADSRN